MTKKQLENKIFPFPKQVEMKEGQLELTKVRLDLQTDVITAETATEVIREKLDALGVAVTEDAQTVISLTVAPAPMEEKVPGEGYQVEIGTEGIALTGFGAKGLYYAAVTLSQILDRTVPCAIVLDWPDTSYRTHKIECRYGSDMMEKEDWMAAIDNLARQKINRVNIAGYGCWVVQYDGRVSEYLYIPIEKYPDLKTPFEIKYWSPKEGKWMHAHKLPPIFEKDFLGELVEYGMKRGVQVFPSFNSFGHNTLIPRLYPEVSPLDENGKPTKTGFCTTNPKTYEMLFGIYDYIIDKYMAPYGADTFSIILDEVWPELAQDADDIFSRPSPWCQCEKCAALNPGQMFVNHAVNCIKHLKEKGMKTVLIDCDMLIDHGPHGIGVLTKPLLEGLKRENLMDVVVIDWWTYADLWEKLMFHTTQPETGLRRVTSPWNGYYAWCCQCNSVRDIYMMGKMGYEENCEGMHCYSSWDLCQDRNNHMFAEYTWGFATAGDITAVTDRYLQQNFPTRFEQARRAFQLFDYITEERIDQPEGNSSCLANYFMLRDRLSYYFYSYVEEGKPYPRIFPGEALEKVCARREDHVRAMLQISGMAKEAMAIWEEIAADPACNQDQARRYAYEADNYLVLVDDYLAMLRMMELTEEGDYAAVRDLALHRKTVRMALMARLEDTKEFYLQPSQLRNNSIFMQFYEDLAAYIGKTPADQVHLDWFDMRYLASERFFWLR